MSIDFNFPSVCFSGIQGRTLRACARNQSGFSMLEFMAGIAILGISVVAVMQLVSYTMPIVKSSSKDVSFAAIQQKVVGWTQSEQTCRIAFGGPGTFGVADGSAVRLNANSPTYVKIYNPNDSSSVSNRSLYFIPSTTVPPTPDKNYPQWVFDNNSFKITPVNPPLAASTVNDVYLTIVATEFSPAQRKTTSDGKVPSIRFTVSLGPSFEILSCGSFGFSNTSFNTYVLGTGIVPTKGSVGSNIPSCNPDQTLTSVDGVTFKCQQIYCDVNYSPCACVGGVGCTTYSSGTTCPPPGNACP